MNLSTVLAFLLYVSFLICIGVFASRKNQNAEEFMLGDRGLGYFVTAISANASDMSVWLFMGLPMAVYSHGIIHAWTALGLVFFMFLNWHFVAPKLRRKSEELKAITLFSFFEKILGQECREIRVFGALLNTFFLTIYVGAGITGMGYLFETIFHLNFYFGCSLAVLAVLTYVSLGGFTAICYTDFAQGIFLLIVVLAIPLLVLTKDHVASEFFPSIPTMINDFIPSSGDQIFLAFSLAFGWGIGYFGQPHILNKFMAIKNPDELKKSKWVGTAWQVLALSGAVLTGLVAKFYFIKQAPTNSELIFVDMVHDLFTPFFGAFILCAVLAATLSTLDSQIIVIASVISEDIFLVFNKKADGKKLVQVSRISTVFICLLGLLIAVFKSNTIFHLVTYCWVGIGASFGPLVIMCLYYKNITRKAAFSGMIIGGSIGLFWTFLETPMSATIPGFLAGIVSIYFISKWTQSSRAKKI